MKKAALFILSFMVFGLTSKAQIVDTIQGNTAQRLLAKNQKLSIGGYGQIDYNQAIMRDESSTGKLDVHRMVLMFGYKFNSRTNFITEIEMEHVSEIYVEQAFLNYRINDYINFRGGLVLIPMGITNEYHEPTTFNGVERPNIDKYIVPSTWREVGAGFTGNIKEVYLKYQVYLVNGFRSAEFGTDKAAFTGANGLRKGRQKGAEAFSSSPNFSTKLDFYGIRGLKIGAAAYIGNSQTDKYNGVKTSDEAGMASADSSVVGVSMFGIDARYRRKGLQLKGQVNIANLSNTDQYNDYYGSDLGSQMLGYLAEVGYNVLPKKSKHGQVIPFVRYEIYHTHQKVAQNMSLVKSYNRNDLTFGLGWKITAGSMLKVDYQIMKSEDNAIEAKEQLNFGVAVWF
jgi:hypothetical protein